MDQESRGLREVFGLPIMLFRNKEYLAADGLKMMRARCVVLLARRCIVFVRVGHWRRMRSDLIDDARKYDQIAKTNGSGKKLSGRDICCFPCGI